MKLLHPQLFLFDAAGALFSAFLLGVVLVKWQEAFGIPVDALYFLASFPLGFFVVDLIAYWKPQNDTWRWLRIVASLNAAYCILSLSVGFYYMDVITRLGWTYLIIEIIILILIIRWEWRASNEDKKATETA